MYSDFGNCSFHIKIRKALFLESRAIVSPIGDRVVKSLLERPAIFCTVLWTTIFQTPHSISSHIRPGKLICSVCSSVALKMFCFLLTRSLNVKIVIHKYNPTRNPKANPLESIIYNYIFLIEWLLSGSNIVVSINLIKNIEWDIFQSCPSLKIK